MASRIDPPTPTPTPNPEQKKSLIIIRTNSLHRGYLVSKLSSTGSICSKFAGTLKKRKYEDLNLNEKSKPHRI
jgi:hypothetical protein